MYWTDVRAGRPLTQNSRKARTYLLLRLLVAIALEHRVIARDDQITKVLELVVLPVLDATDQLLHLLALFDAVDGGVGLIEDGLGRLGADLEVTHLVGWIVAFFAEFLSTV